MMINLAMSEYLQLLPVQFSSVSVQNHLYHDIPPGQQKACQSQPSALFLDQLYHQIVSVNEVEQVSFFKAHKTIIDQKASKHMQVQEIQQVQTGSSFLLLPTADAFIQIHPHLIRSEVSCQGGAEGYRASLEFTLPTHQKKLDKKRTEIERTCKGILILFLMNVEI